ncbi:MAG: hypothetical protein KAI24_25710, partial [Planctomycetes bacterium]|nr:hypothetical protein [Planctomycetota bacterium]
MKTTHLATALLSLLTTTLSAQSPQTLIGLTRVNPSLRKQTTNCQIVSQCAIPGMPGAPNVFAGGTAWDPVRSSAWITNGQILAKVDENCGLECAPIGVPTVTGANTFITGLEVVDLYNQLWMIANDGTLRMFTNTCPPQPVSQCQTALTPTTTPNQRVTTALAVDEGIGLVFVAYANLTTGTTAIAVNDLSNPCQQFDIIQVPPCVSFFGPITGLACDWGSQTLYATDGVVTVSMNYAWNGANLQIVSQNCCPNVIAIDQLVGLAIRPGKATSNGGPCNNGACAPCPMIHRLRNDPVVGNLEFRLGLDGAAGSSFSFCMIGDSPCNNVGPTPGPLCGPVLVGGYVGYLGANLIQGPSICGGSTDFVLPIPPVPALVGDVYSSQAVNLCVSPTGA